MKINSINRNIAVQKYYNNKAMTNVNFSGLKDPDTPCMFVFDLDGTFANGCSNEIQKIIEIQKNRNAKLIYATGRSKKISKNYKKNYYHQKKKYIYLRQTTLLAMRAVFIRKYRWFFDRKSGV